MPEEEKRLDPHVPEKKKETGGEYLFRVLKPAGCVLVLLLFIAYLVFCFTYRSDPAAAPAPPAQTSAQQQ